MSRIKSAIHLGIFAAAFAGTALLLGRFLPPPTVPAVSEKLAYYAAHADEIDTVFLGSSRIYHQIDTALFDQILREHGRESRSFNFGIDGMFSPEDSYLCEQILALKPKALRRIIVENSGFFFGGPDHKPDSIRAAYWHDWTRFKLLASQAFRGFGKKFRWSKSRMFVTENWARIQAFTLHCELLVRRATNLGRAVDIRSPLNNEYLGPHRDGYVPARWVGTAQDLEFFEKKLEERLRPAKEQKWDAPSDSMLRATLQPIVQAGLKPIVLISPTTLSRRKYLNDQFESGAGPVAVLDFSDPEKWPELFKREYRLDRSHLTPPGSEIYTRELAKRFIELEKGKGLKD